MAGGVRVLHLEIVDDIRKHRPEKQKKVKSHDYIPLYLLCYSSEENGKTSQRGSYQGSRKATATPTPAAKETT